MQLSRLVMNTFTLHHERTQSEARRIKLFVILSSLAKRENFSTPLPSSAQRTSTTLTELFRHLFLSLNFYQKKDSLTLIPFVFGTRRLAVLDYSISIRGSYFRAKRKPRPLCAPVGVPPLRHVQLVAELYQAPPRKTRWEPDEGPEGSVTATYE